MSDQDQTNAIHEADLILRLANLPTYTELHYGKMAVEAELMKLKKLNEIALQLTQDEHESLRSAFHAN